MRDTIGAHLAEVINYASLAAMKHRQSLHTVNEEWRDRLLTDVAKHDGATAGHAFRAAELAYDMGQREGRSREMRREEAELRDYAEMAVHWNGEE